MNQSAQTQRIPLEQLFAAVGNRRRLSVGIPSPDPTDRRVPLTPEGAEMLGAADIDVRIERDAARAIHYTDTRYLRAGAGIVSRAEALACDIVIILSPLQLSDVRRMRRGAMLLTLIGSIADDPDVIRTLIDRHIVTIALDLITDRDDHAPYADILNEIDGRAAMASASAILADARHGKGILLGGVAGIIACEVTIIGAGIGGMAAARSAIGMGATVRMFDSDIYRLRCATDRLGPAAITSAMHPRVVVSALRTADVVIASHTSVPPIFGTDIVAQMKQGVITIALDSYGQSDRHPAGIFASMPTVNLVLDSTRRDLDTDSPRVCYTNAAGTVPRTMAMALSNTLTDMFNDIAACGTGVSNTLKLHPGIQRAVTTFMGRPVNARVAAAAGMRPVDITLLLQYS